MKPLVKSLISIFKIRFKSLLKIIDASIPDTESFDLLTFLMEVKIEFYEDKPLIVTLPKSADYEILETEAVVKGQTASSSYKPAVIQNDVKIQVPPFINQGDIVSIDCHSREYIKKAN